MTGMNSSEAILEHLMDSVLVVDETGHILSANPSAGRLFGTDPRQLLGHHFGFPIAVGEVQDIQLFGKGRVLTAQMLASKFTWNGEPAFLLSLRDVSDQRRTEDALAENQRKLEITAEENAQFASLASHDLKEPLRKIQIYISMIGMDQPIHASDQQRLKKIQDAANRMQLLIEGVARLSKFNHDEFHFAPVDLGKLLEQVSSDLEFALEQKKGNIEVGPLPVIDGLEPQLYQLFLNLLSNAIKYSRDDRPPVIKVSGLVADDSVMMRIEDNGIGFAPKFAQQVFHPFRRLHGKKYEGMGIGLTLCQKIVDLHNGTITANGEEGHGATFFIKLPLKARELK